MNFRTEKDSLGEKQVPAGVYYGIQTLRALENYPISGYRANPKLIRAMGMIKKAAALANRELKLLEPDRAQAIVRAAEEVIAGKLASRITNAGVFMLTASESRSQGDNKQAVNVKLDQLLLSAFKKKKARKATKLPKSAKEKRRKSKMQHSEKKKWRQKI